MTKSKKLGLMLGLLVILCLAALAAGTWKSHVEDIAVSGETLLELPASSIQSFSWDEDGEERLAFHRDGENWVYDEDEDFPADNAKVDALLSDFASFGVSFAISEAENPADYGLDDPVAALHLTTTEGKDYDFQLGDFSQLDAQRYLSFGDGKIYLAVHDPWEDFSNATLQTLIQDADVPDLQKDLRHLEFHGAQNYTISALKEPAFYREDDLWSAEKDGRRVAVDPELLDGYLSGITASMLRNYVSYHAVEEEDLAPYGLDDPTLTLTAIRGEGEEAAAFQLSIGLDPEEQKAWDKLSDKQKEDADPVTAYAQIEGSGIVYELNHEDYEHLAACALDDLRHREVLPAEVESIRTLRAEMGEDTYTLTAKEKEDGLHWTYDGADADGAALEDALHALRITDFTDEISLGQLEGSLTVTLEGKDAPEVQIELFRCDGNSCAAVVDGEVLGLVDRSDAMDLLEAVRSIALNAD